MQYVGHCYTLSANISRLHEDYISTLRVCWDGTGNAREVVRVDDGFFCVHELSKLLLKLKMNVWRKMKD